MAESIYESIQAFGGRELALLIISMIPIVELRGAVPIGIAFGMPWFEVLPICIIGNLIPVPFILLLGRILLDWLKSFPSLSRLAGKIERKIMLKSEKVKKGLGFGLLLFVALPVPGTGAWTGAAIASLLGLPLRKSFVEIISGVVIAGLIMTVLSSSVITTLKLI